MLETIGLGVLSSLAATGAYDSVKLGLKKLAQLRPDLEQRAAQAQAEGDEAAKSALAEEAISELIIAVKQGKIAMDGATLEALGAAKLSHDDGEITMKNTNIKGKTVELGGTAGATGTTKIGENTVSQSSGTAISVGKGCGIVITGNASIKQT